jgi:hypothetical protein
LHKIRPAAFGISAKTLSTLRSTLAAALQLAGVLDDMARGLARQHPAWAPLLQAIGPDRRLADGLASFANWCAVNEISPEAVTDQSVKEFSIWLETRTHCPKPQDIVRRVPLLWNEASADIEGWPKSTLTRISFREPRKAQGSLDLLPMNTLYLVILLLNFQCGIVSRTSIRKTKSEGGRELTRKDRYQPEISPSSIRSRMSAATIPALAAAARSSRDAACNDFRATWSGYGRAACEVAPI